MTGFNFGIHARFRNRQAQHFDKDKIMLKRNGESYNVYDHIQKATEDTGIYEVLEKYGCLDKITLDAQQVYADLTNALDLKDQLLAVNEAKKTFYDLPLETRNKFGNNYHTFMQEGPAYLKGVIDKELKAKAEAEKPHLEVKPTINDKITVSKGE